MEDILSSELFCFSAEKVYSDVNIPYPCEGSKNAHNSAGDFKGTAENSNDLVLPHRGSFVYELPNGTVPYNRQIKAMIEKTKPCLTQLMMEAQIVRLWVQYNIPKIEDGNNFGVGIQEEVLTEASSIERDACTFLDQITRYYASRGKLVGKVAKFPHIDDYRECIRDMDEKQAITMRYIIMEIRNHYATLHDIILKNIDRIKMPRSNNAINMY
ncbi:unnamed protein product [Calicophoron daubneyi]